jgi:hypothetical protein
MIPNNKYFRIKCIDHVFLQQLCGTIKNIIAIGGRIVDSSWARAQTRRSSILDSEGEDQEGLKSGPLSTAGTGRLLFYGQFP